MKYRVAFSLIAALAASMAWNRVAIAQSVRPSPGMAPPPETRRQSGHERGGERPSPPQATSPGVWRPPDLFPTRLGQTVGMRAFPPVTNVPGYGNINQPGLPPDAPTLYPNINNPGGPPLGIPPQQPHSPHGGRRGGGTVVYIPYYVYPSLGTPALGSSSMTYSSSGSMTYSSSGYGTSNYQPSYLEVPDARPPVQSLQPTTFLDDKPKAEPAPASANAPPPMQKSADTSPAAARKSRPVTLLAFRDGMIVGVTDYWLEKFTLIYLRSGLRTETPLEQLDLPKTVEVNRELGVPLELESRQAN